MTRLQKFIVIECVNVLSILLTIIGVGGWVAKLIGKEFFIFGSGWIPLVSFTIYCATGLYNAPMKEMLERIGAKMEARRKRQKLHLKPSEVPNYSWSYRFVAVVGTTVVVLLGAGPLLGYLIVDDGSKFYPLFSLCCKIMPFFGIFIALIFALQIFVLRPGLLTPEWMKTRSEKNV